MTFEFEVLNHRRWRPGSSMEALEMTPDVDKDLYRDRSWDAL
jgi:hypothetical protein